ncbi:MAG: toxic anion resistance protein [Pseudomonadota bacterium]
MTTPNDQAPGETAPPPAPTAHADALPGAVAVAAEVAEAVKPPRDVREGDLRIDDVDPTERAAIETRMAEISMTDTSSIIKFGSGAQEKLTEISDQMLEGVRTKDTGPAGDTLRSMVETIRGFNASELDPTAKQSWWDRLLGRTSPVQNFIAEYEGVRGQIDQITETLLSHETILLKDVKFLDRLYDETLGFYDELGLYIAAGEAKLDKLDVFDIPAAEKAAQEAPEGEGPMAAQALRDLRAGRDELERRVHDMKLTRQVTMQSLPSIRLVQENDKALINKINSTLLNTVPLWRQQLAQSVTIARSRDAAAATRAAGDLTNELLQKNAENLRQANREVRTEIERGVFDIETVRKANKELIDTIQESLQIADEGKARRAAAEAELIQMEQDLKTALAAAKARDIPGAATSAAGTAAAELGAPDPTANSEAAKPEGQA